MFDSDIPMQVQIYRQLQAEILDGLWIGREGFPGERELADQFGVSVITSRSALERLAREGLIERGRGRRSRATYIPPVRRPSAALNLFPPPENTALRYKLINHGLDIAPADACRVFGHEPGARLWQAMRLITAGRHVQVVTHHVQPAEIGQRHKLNDLKKEHMVAMLRAEGITLAKIRREVQATIASPVTAHHLGLSSGSAVLMVVLRLEDTNGRTIEWMRAFGRPDQALAEETLDLATGLWASTSPSHSSGPIPNLVDNEPVKRRNIGSTE